MAFVALALVISGVTAGAAIAASSGLTFVPQKADQVTNIDVLRTQIKAYYGDEHATGTFAPDSNYAREAASVAAAGEQWLAAKAGKTPKQAIILDVDDTSLATWNYEVFSNWAYNPVTNAAYVLGEKFPAVPGMVDLAKFAAAKGFAVIWITGRPGSQEAATLANLTTADVAGGVSAGYPAPTTLSTGEDGLFTKPAVGAYPAYLDKPEFCASAIAANKSCATIPYKSGTRAYIESLGYDIVADFGDQYSDLLGGYTDNTFKLPNPNYYLP
jgi:hypothetical protein